MSEPVEKPKKNPESFSPKKPEIVSMMDKAGHSEFQKTITESGIINFEIVKFGPYRFIGKSVYFGNKKGLAEFGIFDYMWKNRDWVWGELNNITEYNSDEPHNAALVTWDRYDDKNQLLGYSVGRFMKADTPVPDGLDYIDIPETQIAKGWWREESDKGKWFAYNDGLLQEEINKTGAYKSASWIFMAEAHPAIGDGLPLTGCYMPCVPLTEDEKAEWARKKNAAENSENSRNALIEMMDKTTPRGESVEIDLAAIGKTGASGMKYSDGSMRISHEMTTTLTFNAPLKIELRAKLDGEHTPHNHMVFEYANGNILINWFGDVCHLHVHWGGDREYEFADIAPGEYMDIEWIIGREFMSIKLNGKLRHIANNHLYIKEFEDNPEYRLSSPVTVKNHNASSAVVVEKLYVTEI